MNRSPLRGQTVAMMRNLFVETLQLLEKNISICPWTRDKDVGSYAQELYGEVEELKRALDNKDLINIKEEVGDVLWDALMIAHLAQRDGLFNAGEVLEGVNKKIKRRKPYLMEGRCVSLEEAKRLWDEAKRKEKRTSVK